MSNEPTYQTRLLFIHPNGLHVRPESTNRTVTRRCE
jgi:hypothetical protein